MVECARLEIVYTGNCIGGSNPSISAMFFVAFFILRNFYISVYEYFNFSSDDNGVCVGYANKVNDTGAKCKKIQGKIYIFGVFVQKNVKNSCFRRFFSVLK